MSDERRRTKGRRGLPRFAACSGLVLGSMALGCESAVEAPPGGTAGTGNGVSGTAGTAAGGQGGSGGDGGTASTPDPGRTEMHRLNTVEYNATVADVLGTTLQPANGNWRGGELGGFDNNASVLGVDEAQYSRYFDAAKTLSAELFADDELRSRFVSCDMNDPACANTAIETAGLRLFRRPLADDEVSTYVRVYETARSLGDAPSAALELAFQALLSSAEFLYRIELDPDPQSTEVHPLGSFELASRLSYFLWSSAPDDRLLQVAADDSLTQPAVLSSEVDRLLADDHRSERFVTEFAGQWLGARQVLSHPVAPELPWSEDIARAAGDEMILYFMEFARNERSWFEFPTADVNFVDDWLALFYGMPTHQAAGVRVEFTEDRRAGFFGLAGFLALSSYDRRTSPSLRGRWIASTLLCTKPDDPPPDVPKLESEGVDLSKANIREALAQHSQNPACAGCHSLFDPYGLALEKFDAIGQYRTTYPDGSPVDTRVTLPESDAYPDGRPIDGLEDLANAVATDPAFGNCLAEKLLTYGLGRLVVASDRPYLEQAQRDWLAPGEIPSVHRLIRALVSSDAFRLRRGEGGGGGQP